MTSFQGDRGANRLGANNERELVPYFVEQVRARVRGNVRRGRPPACCVYVLRACSVTMRAAGTGRAGDYQ